MNLFALGIISLIIIVVESAVDGDSKSGFRNGAFEPRHSLDAAFRNLTKPGRDITGAHIYTQRFQGSLESDPDVKIVHSNGAEILADMTAKISEIFDKNNQALKRLQAAAEFFSKRHFYDELLQLDQVPYVNVRDLGNVSTQMFYDHHFKQDIYNSTSGVHIPIEIYEGYPDILNGLAWSGNLDDVFRENAEKFPEVYWQSFASRDGYMRIYPTARWPEDEFIPDLYDVRRRPWYINGISTPKDVVILLDTSGSMHGQSFDIMKLAAKTLINTLGENDYVNVARFSKNVSWVTPCLTTLVQANARNKRLLFDGIDTLVDHNVASYSKALEFAYTAFEEFFAIKPSHQGADCHKLIMVFSDGGTEYPAKIIKVFSNTTREITRDARIFSYAVGPHPLPTVALKKMACDTGGAFTTITAMGAIRTKIQDYVRVLSKPLSLNKPNDFKRTAHGRDYMRLGLMTTTTLPVFSAYNNSDVKKDQSLFGVVGIDIPVFVFKAVTPRSKLGPLGYSFGLNSNGFTVWHPELWAVANFLEDSADYDFADVEGSTPGLITVRDEMVKLAHSQSNISGNHVVNAEVVLQEGHAIEIEKEYHYGSSKSMPFAVGVSIPKPWSYIEVPPQADSESTLNKLDRLESLVAPWKFCDQTKSDWDSDMDTIDDVLQKLKENSCSGSDLNHLIWDAKLAREAFDKLSSDFDEDDIKYRFVMTDGGVTMFKPQGAIQDFKRMHSDPYNSTLYRATVESSTPMLFVQTFSRKEVIPIYHVSTFNEEHDVTAYDDDAEENEENEDYVPVARELASKGSSDRGKEKKHRPRSQQPTIVTKMPPETAVYLAQSFKVTKDGKSFTAGIAGVRIATSYLKKIFDENSPDDCSETGVYRCYLIDLSGYVLASNQPLSEVSPGDFLGQVDNQIIDHLISTKLFFSEFKKYNYQALCPSPVDCTFGSATSTLNHMVSTVRTLLGLVTSVLNLFTSLHYGVISLFASSYSPVTQASATMEYGVKIPKGMHRCTTETSFWHIKKDAPNSYKQTIVNSCQNINCSRKFFYSRLTSINGILIVADSKCSFCRDRDMHHVAPVEVIEGETCYLPDRFRIRPNECFTSHETEEMECSSGTKILPVFPIMFFTVLLAKF